MDNPFDIGQQGQDPSGGLPPDQQVPQQPQTQAPDQLSHIEAGYNKLREAQKTLGRVKTGLDHLASLGDTVTIDDVVKTAGKLIGGGITPEGMASLLAEAPDTNLEQLMMWIAKRDQDINQRISQTDVMAEQFRHEMGTLAMRKIMANGQAESVAPEQGASPGPNEMTSNVSNSMGL